jgi:hypothetical protein
MIAATAMMRSAFCLLRFGGSTACWPDNLMRRVDFHEV